MLKCDNPLADDELLQRLRQGDTNAFEVLYNRYWKLLFLAARARLTDDEAAKDVVQTLLIDIWQKRKQLQINTSLKQFLFGAVKLKVLQHFRSENIKQGVMDNALVRMGNLIDNAESLASYLNLEKIVSQEVEVMPANMRQSFLLKSDSYSVKEIAKTLNLAEQTVSNNITEAIKRLKRRLRMEYPDRYMNCLVCILVLFTKS